MWVLARSARTGMLFLEKVEHVGVCKYEVNRYSVYAALRDHAEDVAQFESQEEAERVLEWIINGNAPSKWLGGRIAGGGTNSSDELILDLRNLEEVL